MALPMPYSLILATQRYDMHMLKIDEITLSYLLKLRRAKTLSTLETMTIALERDHPLASEQEAIATAWVLREKEINSGMLSALLV